MYFWNVFIQKVYKMYVCILNNFMTVFADYLAFPFCFWVLLCDFFFPSNTSLSGYPRLYLFDIQRWMCCVNTLLCAPFQSCEFVISRVVSPSSVNEATGKESALCYLSNRKNSKRTFQYCDLDFFNMPLGEVNMFDATSCPLLWNWTRVEPCLKTEHKNNGSLMFLNF